MVLMRRKDIIEQYGIDPLDQPDEGGLSVVPKNDEGPTGAITVTEGDKQPEQPNKERESAGAGSNLLAGAFKGFLSDPAMLAGLGYGVYYWASKKMAGEKADFAEGLYKEGGLERVKQHIQEKYQQLKADHPEMNDAAARQAMEDYTATPEFFQFNTDQMINSLGRGLKMANDINQKVGVNKTPDQENFTDDLVQTLGSVLTPLGAVQVGKVASAFAKKATKPIVGEVLSSAIGKAAGVAGNIAEMTVVPGIGKLTPGNVAGNVAGGAVIDEAMRTVTGDPTVLGGDALQEFTKYQNELPNEDMPQGPVGVDPDQEQILESLTDDERAQLHQYLNTNKSEAGIGAAGLLAAGLAAVLGSRGALRGRVAPTIPPVNPRSAAEDFALRRSVETGLNAPVDPNPIHRVIENIDRGLAEEAPLEQLGRELGVEEQVQSSMGQQLSARGQNTVATNFLNHGILADNQFVEPPALHFKLAGQLEQADPQSLEQAHRFIVANEVLDELQSKRIAAQDQLNEAIQGGNQTRITEATNTNTLWTNYDPSIRRYLPTTDEAQLRQLSDPAQLSPNARAYVDSHMRANTALTDMKESSGVFSRAYITNERLHPMHTGLFETSRELPTRYDPSLGRDTSLGPATQRVHNPLSPTAAMRLKMENTAKFIAQEKGKREITHTLRAADPNGEEIRIVPPGEDFDHRFGGTYTYMHGGETVTVQTARKSVADVINQGPVDDGIGWKLAKAARMASQFGMVHGFAGLYQAPISLFYDLFTGYVAQKAGTSFGYLSRFIRQYERLKFGASPFLSRVADLVDMIDVPTRILALGVTAIQATFLKTMGYLGEKFMTQAILRDGLFGHLASAFPGGHQALGRIGARMNQYFWSSWMGSYKMYEGFSPHEMLADADTMKLSYQSRIDRWENGQPRGPINSIRSVFRGYISVLDTIQSLARMTQFAQQFAIEGTGRRSGRPTISAQRNMAEQARRYAGDMSAQPGNKVLKRIGDVVPFARIGMQSLRYILHAMTARGNWDSSLVATRMLALGSAMYASAQLMEEMGLTDWYYEQLNDFERIGKLRLPRPEKVIDYYRSGQWKMTENPEDMFYTVTLPPEISIFMGTMLYGMEQMGFLNRGSNRGNTSAEKDLLYAAGQTFNIGNVPALNAVSTLVGGPKIDIGAGARGRPAFSEVRGPRAQDGDLPSGISSTVAEAMKSMFGFNGTLAIQTLDAGAQSFQKDHNALAAMYRGWDEGKNLFLEKTLPTIPGLWDAKDKVYGTSAISTEIQRQNKLVDTLKDMYSNEFTATGIGRGENRLRIIDPEVGEMLFATNKFFNSGALPKYQKEINNILSQIDDLKANKAKMNYQEVQKQTEAKQLELRPLREEMMQLIQEYQKYLQEEYGQRFEKEGVPPTADGVRALVDRYKTHAN